MPHPLLLNPADCVAVRHHNSTAKVGESLGTSNDTSFFTSVTTGVEEVPGRTGENRVFMQSNGNATMTADLRIQNVARPAGLTFRMYKTAWSTGTGFDSFALNLWVAPTFGSLTNSYTRENIRILKGNNTFSLSTGKRNTTKTLPYLDMVDNSTDTGYTASLWDANYEFLRIQFPGGGQTSKVYIQEVVAGCRWKPLAVVYFDDADESVYNTVFPIMKELGLVGVLPIIGSKLDTAGFMTTAQVKEMFNAGWDIVVHSKLHLRLTEMSAYTLADWRAEVKFTKDLIISNGWNRRGSENIYVYPYGEAMNTGATLYNQALDLEGFTYGIATGDRLTGALLQDTRNICRINMNTASPTITGATDDILKGIIDTGIESGSTGRYMYHRVGDVIGGASFPNDVSMTTAMFRGQMEHLARAQDAGLVEVVTETVALPQNFYAGAILD